MGSRECLLLPSFLPPFLAGEDVASVRLGKDTKEGAFKTTEFFISFLMCSHLSINLPRKEQKERDEAGTWETLQRESLLTTNLTDGVTLNKINENS